MKLMELENTIKNRIKTNFRLWMKLKILAELINKERKDANCHPQK